MVKIVALAGALTHPGKHRETAVYLGDVVDQLHDDDRLADARAAECADLAALREGANQVDDLDARFEHGRFRVLVDQGRSLAVDRVALGRVDRAAAVHGVARHVEHPPEHALAHRYADGRVGVRDLHATFESFGRTHGDGAHEAVAEMLLDLEGQLRGLAGHVELDFQRVVDFRQVAGSGEIHVNDRADDLNDAAGEGWGCGVHKEEW